MMSQISYLPDKKNDPIVICAKIFVRESHDMTAIYST